MKLLKFWLEGRPRATDDLIALQNQIAAIEEQFSDVGAFVFKGCEVTPNGAKYNVAPGLVVIDGKLQKFDGAINVDLPVELVSSAPVESDPRNDGDGDSHNAMVEYKATWQPWGGIILIPDPDGPERIVITLAATRTFWEVVKEMTGSFGKASQSQVDAIAALVELKANAAQPAWQPLTLLNTCTDGAGGTNYSPAFLKDTLGFVHLRGQINHTPSTSQIIAATLPVGFRPSKKLSFEFNRIGNSVQITIGPDGSVTVQASVAEVGGNAWALENISPFMAEQ